MALQPKQSFQHTLKEISVNRESPCELIRELISNAYDTEAKNIRIFPLLQKKGLIFFDDGAGLSMKKNEGEEESPYVAFFSIGIEMKTKGDKIGYKCQGTKLCFASRRFALITRCQGEEIWRTKIIENPQTTLDHDYDISPEHEEHPEKFLVSFLKNPDNRTSDILNYLNKEFFNTQFTTGTMIIIEDFQAHNYHHYFSTDSSKMSYLFNYIRFNTAHGDIRLIEKDHGFSNVDINHVRSHFKEQKCNLKLWMTRPKQRSLLDLMEGDSIEGNLEIVQRGWVYLPKGDPQAESPKTVSQLRKGRFWSKHARAFEFNGQIYTLIFAIDGKRRALDGYSQLGRQRDARCGIPLSSQRGVFLCSHGVKVCSYNQIWDHELLKEKFVALQSGTDHFVFMIDGDFELITNRNALAEQSRELLENSHFIREIKDFLEYIVTRDNHLLKELLQRLRREITEHNENTYLENHDLTKESIQRERDRFCINQIESLNGKWFVEPVPGEEHFVGALYTLFSHVISPHHKLYLYWKRPLTFSGIGIDAVAVADESQGFESNNLLFIEYKYSFSASEEFNHPLSLTNIIICWDFEEDIQIDNEVIDSYGYIGTITQFLNEQGIEFGLIIEKIRKETMNITSGRKITVLSLKRLLMASFFIEWIKASNRRTDKKRKGRSKSTSTLW